MIAFMRGIIHSVYFDKLIIDVNGIGYELNIPDRSQFTIADIGKELEIYTHFQVLENEFKLFGFESLEELELFKLILTVSGIGAKVALSVLSVINPHDFYNAIMSSDEKTLTKIPGVGKKSAQRLIFELKDKLDKLDFTTVKVENNFVKDDELIEVMETLGYTRSEVFPVIASMTKSGELSGILEKDIKLVLRKIASKAL